MAAPNNEKGGMCGSYISNVKKDPNQIEGMDAANRKLAQHLGSPDFEKEAFKNPYKPGETMSYAQMRAMYG